MAGPTEYFLTRDGEVHGPYKMDQLRSLLREGTVSPEDLVASKSSSDWQSLGEIIRYQLIQVIRAKPEASASPPRQQPDLKVFRGLGVAAVCLFLLVLLITVMNLGINIWIETQIIEGSLEGYEGFEKRRLLFTIIIPFFWIILLGAKICLICADRSYISRVLLGLLLGFVAFHSLIGFTHYLCLYPLQNWLGSHFGNLGLIYWLFAVVLLALHSLFVGLLLIKRKWGYRIVLLLGFVVYAVWVIIIIICWGLQPGLLPDIFTSVFGFMEPIGEWLDENRRLRSILGWFFWSFTPLVSLLVLAAPLAFGKSTRPEPELMPRKS